MAASPFQVTPSRYRESRRQIKVLIDGKRAAVIQIVDQLVSSRGHTSHGVVHGHLVGHVTAEVAGLTGRTCPSKFINDTSIRRRWARQS